MNKRLSYILLTVGFLGFAFCGGRFNMPVTAWIWPAALLLFFHSSEGKKRYILTAIALGTGYSIKSIGALGSSVIFDISLGFLLGLVYILPFFVEGLLGERFSGIIKTLAFPLAWTVLEYCIGFSLIGAWNAIGYSQFNNLALMQLSSILGIYGVSFIILWTGSSITYILENRNETRKAVPILVLCPLILILVFSFGTQRLNNVEDTSKHISVAGICGPELEHTDGEYISLPYIDNVAYLEKTVKQAAQKDVDLLSYNEEAFAIDDRYEDDFTEKACRLARENNIDMIVGFDITDTDNSNAGLSDNLIKFINKKGEVEWAYAKTRLVPVVETSAYVKGSGKIYYSDTESGRITSLICFDCDSPQYVQRINKFAPDLLVIPAWEWKGIYENHSNALQIRAIENGIPILKVSYDGIHFAIDSYGRTLEKTNTFTDGFDHFITADIPLNTATTIFAETKGRLNILFIIALLALAAAALARRKK